MKWLQLTSLAILFPIFLSGQNSPLESLTIEDGLSQGMIHDILQDRDGLMWFATKDGLNRYDGYHFKIFNHDPYDSLSISGDVVTALFEDRQGRIWVGTANAGLNCFDKKTERFYRLPFHKDSLLSGTGHFYINAIREDHLGNIWLGINRNMLKLKVPANFPDKPIPDISAIMQAYKFDEFDLIDHFGFFQEIRVVKDSVLWVATYAGLYQLNPSTDKFEKHPFPISGIDQTLVTRILEDSKNRIWLALRKGFLLLDGDIKRFIPYFEFVSREEVSTLNKQVGNFAGVNILEQSENNYLVSFRAFNKAFELELQPETFELKLKNKLTARYFGHHFRRLYQDRSGIIWMGTPGYGLYKYNPQRAFFQHFLPKVSVRNLTVDKEGTLWANGVQNFRVLKNGEAKLIRFPLTPEIYHGIFQSGNGDFWVSFKNNRSFNFSFLLNLDSRLNIKNRYETEEQLTFNYGLIRQDQWKNIWIANNGNSLIRFNPKSEKFSRLDYQTFLKREETKFRTYAFYLDANQNFWIGKDYGLIRLSVNENAEAVDFSFYKNNPQNRNSLSRNVVLSCLDDPKEPESYLWIGTKGGGLNRLEKKTGDFLHFTTKDGLPNNVVYGILSDEQGNLWLSTNRGLSKFNPANHSFQNYTAADGLQDDEFNTGAYTKNEKTGMLYFGGINGVTAFQPKKLQTNPFKPPIVITSFKIHNKELVIQDSVDTILKQSIIHTSEIDLAYHQNLLTIEFAALDFTVPKSNQYQYILEGAMENWVQSGNNRIANFSNLAPGHYTFKVKGTNSQGVWNDKPAILKITIHPPWWKTWGAYAAWFLLAAGVLYFFYRIQINRVKLRNQLAFEQKEAERLAELDRIKSNFFSNITHEFRTPLTLILEPVRQMLKEDKTGHFSQKLKLVKNNSEKLLQLVNQLLDLSKLESGQMRLDLRRGNISEVIRPIYQSFLLLAEKKDIQLKFQAPNDLEDFYFDKNKLEKVVYNLLSNAIKFTSVGSIQLAVGSQQSTVSNRQLAVGNKKKLKKLPTENCLLLTVKDAGIGIPPAELPKIFDRFYQADASSTRENEGTGIGLALTKELVELMGGSIEVESEVGVGTQFKVRLPMKMAGALLPPSPLKGELPPAISMAEDVSDGSPFRGLGGSPNQPINESTNQLILLIEDNPEMRQFIKHSLPKRYQIVEASNGEEGIQKAVELIPDLVISDLMMPKKDGFEVTQTLKNDERTSHVPIILLTAKSAIESKIKGLQKGADAYLTKPFHTEELLVRMEKLIEIRRQLQKKFSNINPGSHSIKQTPSFFSDIDDKFLRRLAILIDQHLDNESLSIEDLSKKVAMSRSQIHRKLKALTGQSATEFLRSYRLIRSMEMLKNKEGNIQQVSIRVGFGSQQYFSRRFKERFGISPSEV